MKILYLGDTFEHSTSAHRANALRRLGHEVTHVNPRSELPKSRIIGGLSVRVGFGIFAPLMLRTVKRAIAGKSFVLAWIDAGAELGPQVHRYLQAQGMKIVNYNVDDPFGARDGKKWKLYRESVKFHDLTVVVRSENISEAEAHGARRVLRVYRSYDPVAHAPVVLSPEEQKMWESEVSFIGTWMPERGPFMAELLKRGVPLTIRGDWWQKAPEWEQLRTAWKGPGIYGRDFVAATQASKVALGLLSKGNRDLHTTRTAEVPYICGPVFCAQDTSEHRLLFTHGESALLWSDAETCAQLCRHALANPVKSADISASAKKAILTHRLSNDEVIAGVLDQLS